MLKYLKLLFLLLPCYLRYTFAASNRASPDVWKPYKTITGNWDEIVNRRVGELRKIWPNCIMNEQFSWMQNGASLSPNGTVFRDIYLKLTDPESRRYITTFLKEQKNGSVYWELRSFEIDAGETKKREAVGWSWESNNTISFNEAVRLVAASPVQQERPADWYDAEQMRIPDHEDWPDQVYWSFTSDGWPVFLGHRDRIIRTREPDSSSIKASVNNVDSVLPNKGLVSETSAVTRKDFNGASRNRGRT